MVLRILWGSKILIITRNYTHTQINKYILALKNKSLSVNFKLIEIVSLRIYITLFFFEKWTRPWHLTLTNQVFTGSSKFRQFIFSYKHFKKRKRLNNSYKHLKIRWIKQKPTFFFYYVSLVPADTFVCFLFWPSVIL